MERERISRIREEFPIFQNVRGPFAYMDNAATTQKPDAVIQRIARFYSCENANIHRGVYRLSRNAEDMYEGARETVRDWIGAKSAEEVVFTKSSTEAVNLAASALFPALIRPGDSVVATELEHSSNYYPWEQQCIKHGCAFRTAKADGDGGIRAEDILSAADGRTRLIAVTGMSNATGFMPDLRGLIRKAHARGILVFVDATQLVVHDRISARDLDCDFLCFSGHKLYGPMGIGVLYGKKELFDAMSPYLYGGDMVRIGDGNRILFREDPGKYEAGTQNIAGALGLEAAIRFLRENRFAEELLPYEERLSAYLRERMERVPGLILYGHCDCISPICNFSLDHCGAIDVGTYLAACGIAVRSGAHCAYPLMRRMGLEASVRVSLSFYNTEEEVDLLTEKLCILAERTGR